MSSVLSNCLQTVNLCEVWLRFQFVGSKRTKAVLSIRERRARERERLLITKDKSAQIDA